MKHLSAIISAIVILLLIVFSFQSLMPSEGTLTSAPATEFSAQRALIPLREIAKAPHYLGTDEHTRVREYIIGELKKLGLETEVQEAFMLSNAKQGLLKPRNIVAKIKGSGNGKSLVLLSHYDSALVPSLGASDAGSGVVTILESLRAYKASGKQPENDIIVLFTDAEEIGLDGANLFVKNHKWAKDVGIVLNFEARGSGGPSNMIVETNGGNTNLVKAFENANVPYPVASSLMYSVYKLLPNDTDSTIFREEGDIESMFFAFIDDHFDYHTANDTVENLNIETLQHQGSYLLPLLHYFADTDLGNLKAEEDSVYVNIPMVKFIHYPFSWILPMLILATLLFIGCLYYGFSKHKLNLNGILKGFIPFLSSLIICGLFGFYGWKLIEYLYPHYNEIQHGFKYNGHWYIVAFVFLSIAITFKMYRVFAKRITVPNLIVAPLLFWLLINLVLLLYLKGGAFFIIPVYFGLISWFLLLKYQNNSYIGLALLAAPALFIFAPLIQFFPVGLGSDHIVISTIFVVLVMGLLLPVIGFYSKRNLLSGLFGFLALVFFVITHLKSDFNEERNKPNSLVYYKNAETNKAYYGTYDNILDDWTKKYLGDSPKSASNYIESAASSKYARKYTFAAEAPTIEIAPSTITINKDSVVDGFRTVDVTLQPQRDIHQLMLYAPIDTPFKSLNFNGVEVTNTDDQGKRFYKRKDNLLLRYYISDNDSLKIQYSIPEKAPLPQIKVLEYGFDLISNPLFNISKRPKKMTPKPFINTDATILEYTFTTEKENQTINTDSSLNEGQ
ncbi:M20/M25/M40 family metallo-hydrolase [Patiriisocius marinus]|nr:M20/M25/M40 family metallo-hydrolase [Patiriisocius marinus]